ncbi:uncharacterized protein Z518_03322 [Rhinocladiella mackenziei CBS 650.93]|uniref:Rhinocladiella mackenziei CBS 650.93 unplaced genomic scaffold supercont1.2, whole genome shotgun sequence n=1 Tax=Rhinocladiella mackenziei CBS 650.93 TaxID=1442369 RepID=A0A0D2JH21_9EURO|nr:uncharacterized protein Z518_03322 [Rhinocladiella mackenziei CBS 650.93]KIX08665.1 hypothetical protein Z518_03322 [Rhinocladiella mackenziei CBS 650.93]
MYFTDAAENLFHELVEPTEKFDISDGAVWADSNSVRFKWPWSRAWHFIDAKDDPPEVCNIHYSSDCDPDKECIIAAIKNMADILVNKTSRVNDPELSKEEQNNAFKFLLHFVGDVTQPLHTEAKCRGGNGIMVQWGRPDSQPEKIHEVWDSLIIKKLRGYKRPRGPDPDNVYDKELSLDWANDLKAKMDGSAIDVARECVDISKPEQCALKWAGEANSFICSYVLKDGVNLGQDEDEDDCEWDWHGPADVSKEYYEGAVPIVEDLVYKAGWRLGQWINALAEQRANMIKSGVVFDTRGLMVQPQMEL